MPVQQHITAGGGVLFKTEGNELFVLLIYRRGVWDLPKGKQEDNETVEQCALREVAEEVGCPLPSILGKLTETYHEYSEDDKEIGKTTHWFAMQTDQKVDFEPERQEGIEKVKWVNLRDASQIVGYENLIAVLESFREWIKPSTQKKA